MGRDLKWKTIRASVVGTSHVETETECQDCCWAEVLETKNHTKYLVAIVSDGAGSAINGGTGSKLTCETLVTSITSSLEQQQDTSLSENNVIEWIKNAKRKIYSLADENNLTARDYACTVLCSIVAENTALFFQIGDGAIVVSKYNALGVVFWPDSGEYVNSTYFITDEDAISTLRITKVESKINEVALFSDGLQHLALSYALKTPHHPFFDPMFNIMRNRKNTNCDDLDKQLQAFLNSDEINSRTDDDKTLVLATCEEL